jgi:hypothetical protein
MHAVIPTFPQHHQMFQEPTTKIDKSKLLETFKNKNWILEQISQMAYLFLESQTQPDAYAFQHVQALESNDRTA